MRNENSQTGDTSVAVITQQVFEIWFGLQKK
jgi:hypothetical protein